MYVRKMYAIIWVFGANALVCAIQTSVCKSLARIFTNVRLYITMTYYLSLCIDVCLFIEVVGYIDHTHKWYLRMHIRKLPTIICV